MSEKQLKLNKKNLVIATKKLRELKSKQKAYLSFLSASNACGVYVSHLSSILIDLKSSV